MHYDEKGLGWLALQLLNPPPIPPSPHPPIPPFTDSPHPHKQETRGLDTTQGYFFHSLVATSLLFIEINVLLLVLVVLSRTFWGKGTFVKKILKSGKIQRNRRPNISLCHPTCKRFHENYSVLHIVTSYICCAVCAPRNIQHIAHVLILMSYDMETNRQNHNSDFAI